MNGRGTAKSKAERLVIGLSGASGVAYGIRPLVLMVRETPLHLGHLRTMTALAEMGAIILPPVPAFYAEPRNLSDLVDQMVGRALDLFGYNWPDMRRWGEDLAKSRRKGNKA